MPPMGISHSLIQRKHFLPPRGIEVGKSIERRHLSRVFLTNLRASVGLSLKQLTQTRIDELMSSDSKPHSTQRFFANGSNIVHHGKASLPMTQLLRAPVTVLDGAKPLTKSSPRKAIAMASRKSISFFSGILTSNPSRFRSSMSVWL